ncbi:unnamed protein product [Vicia faba]|uniref:Uncharacterized protein n=1 Tax=Vicia faba TaxID=3906 RepID=A0AAV1A530_VICFA|nr:unnamed protein product [Vicia faba]
MRCSHCQPKSSPSFHQYSSPNVKKEPKGHLALYSMKAIQTCTQAYVPQCALLSRFPLFLLFLLSFLRSFNCTLIFFLQATKDKSLVVVGLPTVEIPHIVTTRCLQVSIVFNEFSYLVYEKKRSFDIINFEVSAVNF